MATASSFWTVTPGRGEIRSAPLRAPASGELVVRAVASGISRGTESLVFKGRVPESEFQSMRCPLQEGNFPGPVKYGYASVGVIEGGRHVFCLHPHQDTYVVPLERLVPLPDRLPPKRAVLAANFETAINALWDAPPRIGDRVTVIGAGVVGACIAALVARIPGVELEVLDIDEEKRDSLAMLGISIVNPARARGERDLIFHTSGTERGLARALDIAGMESTIVELSWYGSGSVNVPLGASFHSRRLTLKASQVGQVAAAQRSRRTHRERLALALELLAAEPNFDALITSGCTLAELPAWMPRLANGFPGLLCHVVTYP